METLITVGEKNKTVKIVAPVPDSLHASLLSDRLDKLPYIKVSERKFNNQVVTIKAYTIPSLFSYEQLQNDLESFNLIIPHHESIPNSTEGNKN